MNYTWNFSLKYIAILVQKYLQSWHFLFLDKDDMWYYAFSGGSDICINVDDIFEGGNQKDDQLQKLSFHWKERTIAGALRWGSQHQRRLPYWPTQPTWRPNSESTQRQHIMSRERCFKNLRGPRSKKVPTSSKCSLRQSFLKPGQSKQGKVRGR